MNFLIRISFIILLLFLLQSCSKKEEVLFIQEDNQEQEMITAYNKGIENLNNNDEFYAAKKFLEAELLFPQSDWAPKSALMASYSYYIKDY